MKGIIYLTDINNSNCVLENYEIDLALEPYGYSISIETDLSESFLHLISNYQSLRKSIEKKLSFLMISI